jgi:phospholipid/cholesterol/gamma-HCH transport system permease protein
MDEVGGVTQLCGRAVRALFKGRLDVDAVVDQIEVIGLQSTSVAALTAIFSGMVMTVQFAVQMSRFGAKEYVSSVVSLSLARELGPVLTALMVGGRIGAGIAAELGSMNVTEQVDAIRSMGADPIRQLVLPRVLATLVALPLLGCFAVVIGVGGAMAIARVAEGINMMFFYNAVLQAVHLADFFGGLLKTVVFALLVSLIACHQGLTTTGGTEGVGRATTRTVVVCSIATLISDFLLTNVLLSFGL